MPITNNSKKWGYFNATVNNIGVGTIIKGNSKIFDIVKITVDPKYQNQKIRKRLATIFLKKTKVMYLENYI